MGITQARRARMGRQHMVHRKQRRACRHLTVGIWRLFMFYAVSAFLSSRLHSARPRTAR